MSITGERLRELRKSKRRTLKDVQNDIGISYSGLASIERGDNNCNATTLKILADYYDVTTDYLMGNTDNKNLNEMDKVKLAFFNQEGIVTPEQQKMVEDFIAMIKRADTK